MKTGRVRRSQIDPVSRPVARRALTLTPCARAFVAAGLAMMWPLPAAFAAPPSAVPKTNLPIPCAGAGICGPYAPQNLPFVTNGQATYTLQGTTGTVSQSTARAILNWQNFNIGAGYSLRFVQPTSDSATLNRVFDVSPSVINGALQATGQVYLINRNGVLFGPGAQVDTSGLVAASLNISDARFLNGLLSTTVDRGIAVFDGLDAAYPSNPLAVVGVLDGAAIRIANAGRVMLLAPRVENSGVITAPDGQVILAAGSRVYLQASADANLRGVLIEVANPGIDGKGTIVGSVQLAQAQADNPNVDPGSYPGGIGAAKNLGTIVTDRGNTTLVGLAVNQSGRISASTSVRANGSIWLIARDKADDAASPLRADPISKLPTRTGSVELGANSRTQALPDADDTATIQDAQTFNASAVNIQGRTVHLQSNASIVAPGGTVSIGATVDPQQAATQPNAAAIELDAGASIDVAGLKGVAIPVTRNVMEIELRGDELKDAPLQRNSFLRGKKILVDVRKGTPLIADLSGFTSQIGRSIAERSTTAGAVALNSEGSVVLQRGSTIDLSGGSIDYRPGWIQTTQLYDAQGRIVDISNADPSRLYAGFADRYSVNYVKWGVQETFHLNRLGVFDPGYVEGRPAGRADIVAPALYLGGTLTGTTTRGPQQRSDPALAGATLVIGAVSNTGAGAPDYGLASNVTFSGALAALPATYAVGDALPDALREQVTLDPAWTTTGGIANLAVYSNGLIRVPSGTQISTPAKGSISLAGQEIAIDGRLSVPSGTVALSATAVAAGVAVARPDALTHAGSIGLGPDATLTARGPWVNDYRAPTAAGAPAVPRATEPTAPDGGRVSLVALNNVLLAPGSVVDVSGGGWVNRAGALAAGNGGTISIKANVGAGSSTAGSVFLGADLRADALGKGGMLGLAAPGIEIGGPDAATLSSAQALLADAARRLDAVAGQAPRGSSASATQAAWRTLLDAARTGSVDTAVIAPLRDRGTDASTLVRLRTVLRAVGRELRDGTLLLDPSIFTNGGFASYALTASTTATVVSGTAVRPIVSNWILNRDPRLAASGSDLASFASIGPLPDDTRGATQLSLSAARNQTGRLQVQSGASITTDPGSTVALSADKQITIAGSVVAPAGTITLGLTPSVAIGDPSDVGFDPAQSIWLASNARLSVAGTARTTVDAQGAIKGSVLAGGSIAIAAGKGYVVAERGATIDVSGASAYLDIASDAGGIGRRADSDAGTLTLAAREGVLSNATLRAHGGADTSAGGSISVSIERGVTAQDASQSPYPTNDRIVVVRSGATAVPAGLRVGDPIAADFNGRAFVDADALAAAGFDTIALRSDNKVRFDGAVDVRARSVVRIDAPVVTSTNAQSAARIGASYVSIGNTNQNTPATPAPSLGAGTLNVGADLIDLIGHVTLDGTSAVVLDSRSDIRLRGVLSATQTDTTPTGALTTAGDLTLRATQVFPVSLTNFTIDTKQRLEFASNGAGAAVPFSAGGTLAAHAAQIVQGGTIRAPFGRIALVADDRLTLTPQSVTSVSGAGTVIPFGQTANGREWLYTFVDRKAAIAAPPHGRIDLTGSDIDIRSGATVDLSGGGDLYGYEFTPGPGGSKDVLDNRSTYAILPGYRLAFAPYDEQYNLSSLPAVGTRIHLAGGNGLPAGDFTLLPARYALLPGAYAVTMVRANSDLQPGQGTTRTDGSSLVAGYLTSANGAVRDSRWSTFSVTPSSGIRSQSQTTDSYATAFFTALADRSQTALPRLPIDAGVLSIGAQNTLSLAGSVRLDAAVGGQRGDVDIGAARIAIVDDATRAPSGALVLDANQLARLGAGSLLIGGTRAETDGATVVRVVAGTVDIANHEATALQASEVVIAAKDAVHVGAGSVLRANDGTGASKPISIDGDGALVRVTSREANTVDRGANVAQATGAITVDAGAVLQSSGALLLDATKTTSIAPDAQLRSASISIASRQITIGGTPASGDGLVLGSSLAGQLQNARDLTLRSYGSIDLIGTATLGARDATGAPTLGHLTLDAQSLRGIGNAGAVSTITAASIALTNSRAAGAAPSASSNAGTLVIAAIGASATPADARNGRISLGAGDKTISGFANVALVANDRVTGDGTGVLNVVQGASDNTSLQAPLITAGTGARQTVNASGVLTTAALSNSAATSAPDGSGASLALQAQRIDVNGSIDLPAGHIALNAGGTGDAIRVEPGATIRAGGVVKPIFDALVRLPGGTIDLTAPSGNIVVAGASANASAAVVDASASAAGAAGGAVRISAPQGSVAIAGTLSGGGAANERDGSFAVDARTLAPSTGAIANDIDSLNRTLNAGGFNESRDVRVRTGDISIGTGAALQAHQVTLAADGGVIDVAGSISTLGAARARVQLAARDDVVLRNGAVIDAHARADGAGGGRVELDTSRGKIDAQAGSLIDVRAASGGEDGSVRLRAPRTNASDSLATALATGGNAAAFTASAPNIAALTPGLVVTLTARVGNASAATTFNLNGFGAAPIRKNGGAALAPADIAAGTTIQLVYDGSRWLLASRDAGTDVAVTSSATGAVVGASRIEVEAVRSSQLTALDANAINALRADTQAFMANASPRTSRFAASRDGRSATLLPGVEVVSTTDLAVGANLDLRASRFAADGSRYFDWRYGAAPQPSFGSGAPDSLGTPGVLTLRATGNLSINASINDGYSAVPTLPTMVTTLQSGDSWSYRLVGGADLGAANPLATLGRSVDTGDVRIARNKLVRSGNGSIDIAASRDFTLVGDRTTGGYAAVYTGGKVVADLAEFVNPSAAAFGSEGGDIRIVAGRDANGFYTGQLVTNWLFRRGTLNADGSFRRLPNGNTAWWTRADQFQQNIATFGGGGVTIAAGRDVNELSASAATSARIPGTQPSDARLTVYGGGNVDVQAGRDVKGGLYFVARGAGSVRSQGSIAPGNYRIVDPKPIATRLALGDGTWSVAASGDIDIETIFNPTALDPSTRNAFGALRSGFFTYSAQSAATIQSAAGNVTLNDRAAAIGNRSESGLPSASDVLTLYPGTLRIEAPNGAIAQSRADGTTPIVMFPSANGNLTLLAGTSISLAKWIMSDADPALVPRPTAPVIVVDPFALRVGHAAAALHENDPAPVRVYAASGDISGVSSQDGTLTLAKAASIHAGRDLSNLSLTGQNIRSRDVTEVIAGRDLTFDTARTNNAITTNFSTISLGGPGELQLQAGRNVDLGNSAGVVTRGNLDNPALADAGAGISVSAGAPQGAQWQRFASRFLDPGREANRQASYGNALIDYVANVTGERLTESQAWVRFQSLSENLRKPLIRDVFYRELRDSGREASNANGPRFRDYTRGFAAIEALFPSASSSLVQNTPLGANQRALVVLPAPPYRGDINVFFSQIRTERGGNIDTLAPGGSLIAGLANVPADLLATKATTGLFKSDGRTPIDDSASKLGVVTVRGGSVRSMSDGDYFVNQSRVFTLGGGDIVLWSSNGNIDAGKGKKTASSAPPPIIRTDANGKVLTDISGVVSGSGIGVLLTQPGTVPGDVDLIAPRGEVNAGDAGIRAAGNLNIAAVRVVGADNIQVGGLSTGVPLASLSSVGASLAGLGNLGSDSSKAAEQASRTLAESSAQSSQQLKENFRPAFVTVEVICLGNDCK